MSRDETAGLRAAQLRLGRLPGYVRRPDPARRSGAQGHTYKKGWEVRFTARSEAEIAEIRDLVVAAGFAPARPFFKGHQLIQPVYGMAAVQAYLAARQVAEEQAERTAHGRARRGTGAARPGTATKAAYEAVHEAAQDEQEAQQAQRTRKIQQAQRTGDPGPAQETQGAGNRRDTRDFPEFRTDARSGAVEHATAEHGTADTAGPGARGRGHERERLAAATEAAGAAGAAAAAAARLARLRAVEVFPAQLARGTSPDDRVGPAESHRTTP
ncbi:hypothetical protein ACFCX4_14895 [Kitasatospora sp. NPDC056327]|uniref:hypothetical protein n=1 Tax=Kitasatospora sp. NPDC056327 TaxID=3345785 RepID=UPI0035E19651